jgi:hypothetical protein
MPRGEDRTRDHAFIELGWRLDAEDRTGGQRERGRLDRIELRLDLDDRIVLVAAVEETTKPDLIRQFNVGQGGERDHHAHEKQHEGPAHPHHRPLATPFA